MTLLSSRSIGANWGYDIPDEQVAFAHRLIDSDATEAIEGHVR
jgi:hypothetical protein